MEDVLKRLLIVAHQNEWLGIQHAFKVSAAPDWQNNSLLGIWLTDDQGAMFDVFSSRPVTWDDVTSGLTIVATKQVPRLPKDKLSQVKGCPLLIKSGSHYFQPNREGFVNLLHRAGISWEAYANDMHAKYDHGSKLFGISDWLDQFKRIGAYDVGKMILRGTRVKLTRECVKQFHSQWNGEPLNKDSIIGVLSSMGKSGAALSPGLAKSFNSQCLEFGECIELCADEGVPRLIHIFEDGLWTGIELKKVIDSLRGVAQKKKCKPLRNADDLQKNEIVFHFSVMTDLGYYAALDMFKKEGFTNFKIDTEGAERVDVLTDEGKRHFSEGIVGFSEVESFDMRPDLVQPHFLKTTNDPWGLNNIHHASTIVSQIGLELWKQRNPSIKIDPHNCAHLGFGSNGIGSSLIFGHSVGQAVLPVLWCNGSVNWGKKKIEWRGLYPERPNG